MVGALHASPKAGLAQDPPPLPTLTLATGKGMTVLHRFDFDVRVRQPTSVNVAGRGVFEPRSAKASRYFVRVTCLRVTANRAVLGGSVFRAGGGSHGVLFFVEDNGRGAGVDRISRLVLLRKPPEVCPAAKPIGSSGLRVRVGDIVVKGG